MPRGSRSRRWSLALLLPAVLAAGFWLQVQGDARPQPPQLHPELRASGARIAREGAPGVSPCVACHGERGEGDWARGHPRLAGLHPGYIEKQLADYARVWVAGAEAVPAPSVAADIPPASGVTGLRQDAVMTPIARALDGAQRQALAVYYAGLPFERGPAGGDPALLARGQALALRGKPELGMPACATCHGSQGQGHGRHFPPLTGQPAAYLSTQLDRWQGGQRDNDPLALMRHSANRLSDAEQRAVAAWYASLPHGAAP